MSFAGHYLELSPGYSPQISLPPSDQLGLCVVIPAYKEPDLMPALQSLASCRLPDCAVEILVVINCPENASEEILEINKATFETVNSFKHTWESSRFRIYPLVHNKLPLKEAGVGLARKIGMDEALYRFHLIDRPGGIIASFDADATCDDNYLSALYARFTKEPTTTGCAVYYEHSLDTVVFGKPAIEAIVGYELHLRYYNQALRHAGFPYAYHTVGSSFAVKASAYARQGGMNRKKAGEDFYFLHKIIPLGGFVDLTSTRIHLSPRVSDRVPFGTGAAMGKIAGNGNPVYQTYNFKAFEDIRVLFGKIPEFYQAGDAGNELLLAQLPLPVSEFLKGKGFLTAIQQMNENSTSLTVFQKRFFQWWSAFRIMKYLNFSHTGIYDKKPVSTEAALLLNILGSETGSGTGSEELLAIYRKLERTGNLV